LSQTKTKQAYIDSIGCNTYKPDLYNYIIKFCRHKQEIVTKEAAELIIKCPAEKNAEFEECQHGWSLIQMEYRKNSK